jgi:hypothetical protein
MNPMAQKWKDVRKPLSPEAEQRIQQVVKEAAAVMTLHQLREAPEPDSGQSGQGAEGLDH